MSFESRRFALFRFFLGALLVYYFASLMPWANDLFTEHGMLPRSEQIPGTEIVPEFLQTLLSTEFIHATLSFAVISAISLAFGFYRRIAAALLYAILLLTMFRNPLLDHVGIDYLGWMLLVCIVTPSGESFAVRPRSKQDWNFPRALYLGGWLILAFGYSYSGHMKWANPAWQNGTAMCDILSSPLGGANIFEQLICASPTICKVVTWGTLCLEFFSLPLCCFSIGRQIIWWGMFAVHIGIFFSMSIDIIPLSMMIFHVLIFHGFRMRLFQTVKGS